MSCIPTHGLSRGNVVYKAWQNIKDRCLNPRCGFYDRYGGRGIRVYEPWIHDPVAFVAYVDQHLGPRPSPRHSIDRVDNEGHYGPGNIRWASYETQNRNRHMTKYTGKLTDRDVACIRHWADAGVSQSDLAHVFGVDQSHVSRIKTRAYWPAAMGGV